MKFNTYQTPLGELQISIIGHASAILQLNGKIIYTDPYGKVTDYSSFPKADLILITHEHYDHLDKTELEKLVTSTTKIISTPNVAKELGNVTVLKNGEQTIWENIEITATPAYNIIQKNDNGQHFHPKGNGNGYLLNISGYYIYIAGDTELIPEMKMLKNIEIAFLPKNLPYTMSDEMFIETAKLIQPKILYPYHYFEVDKAKLQAALPNIKIQ